MSIDYKLKCNKNADGTFSIILDFRHSRLVIPSVNAVSTEEAEGKWILKEIRYDERTTYNPLEGYHPLPDKRKIS